MLCSLVLKGTIKQSDMDTAVSSVDATIKVMEGMHSFKGQGYVYFTHFECGEFHWKVIKNIYKMYIIGRPPYYRQRRPLCLIGTMPSATLTHQLPRMHIFSNCPSYIFPFSRPLICQSPGLCLILSSLFSLSKVCLLLTTFCNICSLLFHYWHILFSLSLGPICTL